METAENRDGEPASPGIRFGAALIDALAVAAILIAGTAITFAAGSVTRNRGVIALAASLGGAAAAAYLLPEAFTGRTLGKRLLRLRVVGGRGRRQARRALLARWAVKCSPVYVATAVLCAEIAANQYPLTTIVVPLAWQIHRLLEGVVGPSLLLRSIVWSPAVYGAGIPFAVILLAGCLPALGPRRLALHDRLTGTAVYADGPRTPRGFDPLPPANAA